MNLTTSLAHRPNETQSHSFAAAATAAAASDTNESQNVFHAECIGIRQHVHKYIIVSPPYRRWNKTCRRTNAKTTKENRRQQQQQQKELKTQENKLNSHSIHAPTPRLAHWQRAIHTLRMSTTHKRSDVDVWIYYFDYYLSEQHRTLYQRVCRIHHIHSRNCFSLSLPLFRTLTGLTVRRVSNSAWE